MKQIILVFLICGLLCINCFAAPLYGPDMPRRGQWYIGFETNLVSKRDMRKGLGEAETDQYFYNASYGLYDWFSFDGKLGGGDIEFDTKEAGHLDFDLGFAGAYGARFKIYNDEAEKIRAIFGFQHISVHPPKEKVGSVEYRAIWDEWQFSLLLSKAIRQFEPYLGIKASQLNIIRKDNFEDAWAWNGSRRHFGIVTGSKIDIFKNCYLDLEGRFIDETAFSAALSWQL
ncbi:MAG: hypothetical protein NC828_02520 [Candidatus Omnitrophica bacterium]|nr:hypothetical protein [Candidatus Omnitrophota bacterium]